jgi:hypothetical protein
VKIDGLSKRFLCFTDQGIQIDKKGKNTISLFLPGNKNAFFKCRANLISRIVSVFFVVSHKVNLLNRNVINLPTC